MEPWPTAIIFKNSRAFTEPLFPFDILTPFYDSSDIQHDESTVFIQKVRILQAMCIEWATEAMVMNCSTRQSRQEEKSQTDRKFFHRLRVYNQHFSSHAWTMKHGSLTLIMRWTSYTALPNLRYKLQKWMRCASCAVISVLIDSLYTIINSEVLLFTSL